MRIIMRSHNRRIPTGVPNLGVVSSFIIYIYIYIYYILSHLPNEPRIHYDFLRTKLEMLNQTCDPATPIYFTAERRGMNVPHFTKLSKVVKIQLLLQQAVKPLAFGEALEYFYETNLIIAINHMLPSTHIMCIFYNSLCS